MSKAYDDVYISKKYSGRVRFSRQVEVRPFDRMLPAGASHLRSQYEPLRQDHSSDTNSHPTTNGRRNRIYNLPTVATASSSRYPEVVNHGPSPPARPSEPSVETRHSKRQDNRHSHQHHRENPRQPNTQPWPVADISTQTSAQPSVSEASRSQHPPHEDNIAPRARTGSSESVASTLRRVFRSGSSTVTPALGIRSNDIQWDMRQSPTHQDGAHIPRSILDQPAMSSNPESCMAIKHDLLPWPILVHIDVDMEHPPTIRDVLKTISKSLQTHIGARDLYNLTTSERRLQIIARAAERRGAELGAYRRVDFLGEEYMFGGLEHISGTNFRVRSFAP